MASRGYRDCPYCAEPVRLAAKLCPHCRSQLKPQPKSNELPRWLALPVIVIIIVAVFANTSPEDRPGTSPATSDAEQAKHSKPDETPPADAKSGAETDQAAATPRVATVSDGDGWYMLKTNWAGCRSEQAQDKLTRLAASGDDEAYTLYLIEVGLTGECEVLKSGTEVYLDQVSSTPGLVCLRRRGETSCLWTLQEAVVP